MKRYFVDGKEITEAEAKEIERKNNEYLASGDFNEMLKIKFIVVI
jgi:hypothetical protein